MREVDQPREHQLECLAAIRQVVEAGGNCALIVMASGLGKTHVSMYAIEQFYAGRRFDRVLILCHSEDILRQSRAKFEHHFGPTYTYGMYVDTDKATRRTDFLFATFQTMKEHRVSFPIYEFGYIVVDEAHHTPAPTYGPTVEYFQGQFLLALTATPHRSDGQKLADYYGEPVYQLDFIAAARRGLVVDIDYHLITDDLRDDQLKEYALGPRKLSLQQLNRTLFIEKRDEEIVRIIKAEMTSEPDPRTIIFCRSVPHAERIAQLMGAGAVVVHNGRSKPDNNAALEAFRCGAAQAIVSVQMLNEGIDVPDANIIVFLRNTVSRTVFYQQLCRGTRLAPGKTKVKVLDFVGNCERIKMVIELEQAITEPGDARRRGRRAKYQIDQQPTAGQRPAQFTLDIATSKFKTKQVDLLKMLLGATTYELTASDEVTTPPLDQTEWTKETALAAGVAMLERGKELSVSGITVSSQLPSIGYIILLFDSVDKFIKQAERARKQRRKALVAERYWLKSRVARHLLSTTELQADEEFSYADLKLFGGIADLRAYVEQHHGPFLSAEELANDAARERAAKRATLAEEYYRASLKAKHWLVTTEFGSGHGTRSLQYYLQYFDDLDDLAVYVNQQYGDIGGTPKKLSTRKTKGQLLELYYQQSKAAGHWLNATEINRDACLPSCATFLKTVGVGKLAETQEYAKLFYGKI